MNKIAAALVAALLSVGLAHAQMIPLTGGGGAAHVNVAGGCPQATTFIARTSGENTTALTTMICGLVTDGIITGDLTSGGTKCGSSLDRFYIMAMANSTDALLDVCGNASLVSHGSPTFTANAGYIGVNGSTTVWLDTGFNPSTAGGNYVLNSAHLSAWSLTNATSTGVAMGANNNGTGTAYLDLEFTDTKTYTALNDADTDVGHVTANSSGFFVSTRSGSSSLIVYRNGSLLYSPNLTSNSLPARNIFLLAESDSIGNPKGGAAWQLAEASFGANLTSGFVTALNSRICTYLTTVHGSC